MGRRRVHAFALTCSVLAAALTGCDRHPLNQEQAKGSLAFQDQMPEKLSIDMITGTIDLDLKPPCPSADAYRALIEPGQVHRKALLATAYPTTPCGKVVVTLVPGLDADVSERQPIGTGGDHAFLKLTLAEKTGYDISAIHQHGDTGDFLLNIHYRLTASGRKIYPTEGAFLSPSCSPDPGGATLTCHVREQAQRKADGEWKHSFDENANDPKFYPPNADRPLPPPPPPPTN